MQWICRSRSTPAGRLTNAYGMQASALDASKLQLERARQELQLQVVETFYAALMNEQGVRVADEQIALATKQLSLAKARFDAGSVARLDVLQAEVELANSKARRIQAKAAVDTSYQALRTVLSLPQSQALVAPRQSRRAAGDAHPGRRWKRPSRRGPICGRSRRARTWRSTRSRWRTPSGSPACR